MIPILLTLSIVKDITWNTLNKHQQAIECFDKALQIDPNNKVAQKNKEASLKMITYSIVLIYIYNS
jgi:tetratricopeptide (TPR) repeat protein